LPGQWQIGTAPSILIDWKADDDNKLTLPVGLGVGKLFNSLGSRDKPKQNNDSSIDLYFGAKAPKGNKANWVATVPGRGFFAIIRLNSPTEGAFDGSWKPGDFKELK
jgi:hypothetical protein